MIFFLGILEQKGIDAISEYARLIAEVIPLIFLVEYRRNNVFFQQLKLEKGDVGNIGQQIEDLNNINSMRMPTS